MQQRSGWKERLADSSWVTLCWDWFMTLVGRAVEAVLWVTMAFCCYQLIPAAPQPLPGVSACAFIAQFLALDAGGLGLYKLAEQQGLGRWAYARVVSSVLIGITLVTVAYAGIQHATQVDASLTKWVEVSLVIARSSMTVLYGLAIQSLRAAKQAHTNEVTRLQEERDRAQQQVDSGQAEVSRLRVQLDTKSKEVDGLCGQVEELRVTAERSGYEREELRAMIEQVTEWSGYELQATVARYEQEKQAMVTSYQSQVESLSCELQAAKDRLALVTSKASTKATPSRIARHEKGYERRATDSPGQGYVAVDDGATVAVSNGYGKTLVATGSHRDRIKRAMVQAMTTGQAMTYQDIAQAAGVGYSTVKKYASAIRQELEQSTR